MPTLNLETAAGIELRFAPDEAGLLSGYAAVWGKRDAFGDRVQPGAFAKSLAAHKAAGTRPLMLKGHNPNTVIGTWDEVREDATGLKVSGRLVLDATEGRDAYALLKAQAIDGLSIGFRTVRASPATDGGRIVHEMELIEVSLVARPAQPDARVLNIRSTPNTHPHQEDLTMPNTPTETLDSTTEVRSAIDGFTATVNERFGSLEGTLTELRTRLDHTETVLRRPGAVPESRTAGEVETRAFGTFLRHGRERLDAIEVRSLRVSDDTAGGYLAPEQFVAEMLRNLVQFSPVRSVARVMPTSAQAVLLPKRTGTLTASWVGETAARPGTEPTYGQNRYDVRELACFVDVSNQMLEDSAFDMASELAFDFAEEFGKAEGAAFVTGDGTLKPLGFMTDLEVTNVTTGDAAKVTADSLIGLYHALPTAYRANATWAMNANTLASLRKLKTANGDYLLVAAGVAGAPSTTLLGRPVIEMPDMEDIAAGAEPILFGDFAQGYRIFDRIALSVLRDPYSQAVNGQTRFHARRRVAAGVAKAEALRKLKVAV